MRNAEPPGRVVAILAIASSAGGPQVIQAILSRLPSQFPPIVIAQHIGDGFINGMVGWLARSTPLKVKQAVDGELLTAGTVYFNPAESAMTVEPGGTLRLAARETDQVYQPCCNTLLESVARVYRERAVGLILTGMGDDGVAGMQAIRQAGGLTLAQDAASSVIFGMNGLAIARGGIDRVLDLDRIPVELMNLIGTT
jgi:two-component system chemotaxis response regulator CheB